MVNRKSKLLRPQRPRSQLIAQTPLSIQGYLLFPIREFQAQQPSPVLSALVEVDQSCLDPASPFRSAVR
jgi:hypothetical protein